ncbi:MAG: transcription termination factor NusA [Gammaproteobacteria bacterium]|jgi:N utilization substance protein A|nr:transcription termination factor NusA [Gammaproteobacteria bacterium]
MNKEILLIIDTVSNEKNVDREIIINAMETALASAVKKKYKLDNKTQDEIDVEVTINQDDGTYTTIRKWEVVDEILIDDEYEKKMLIEFAKEKNNDINVGEYITEEIESVEFGRIVAQTAKQNIVASLKAAERNRIVDLYAPRVGELLFGIVRRVDKNNVFLDLNSNEGGSLSDEAMILKENLIPRENIKPGDRIRGFLMDVQSEQRGPQLYISRKCPEFLIELFRLEVPEVGQGIIEILGASRDPGLRAKIAVKSNDPKLDAIGACVGMRGSRVQSVSNELAGERIDIIAWDEDPAKFVINAMSPAEVLSIVVDETSKTMDIAVAEEQLSQAIGRGGQNVRLASELTGWNLNVMSKDDADDKNNKEEEETATKFQVELNVDNDVAKILAEEGFSSIDEIALCEIEELQEINGFDDDLVNELRKRAIDAYDKKQKELDDKKSLSNLNELNDDHITLLKNNDILTISDVADLSIDELLDFIDISNESAGKVIMQARESWSEEE